MKRVLILIVAVLLLTGCAGEQDPDLTLTYPSLPELPTQQTPLQQLTDAIDKTRELDRFVLSFGQEDLTRQQVEKAADGSYTSLLTVPDGQQIFICGTDRYTLDPPEHTTADQPFTAQQVFQEAYALVHNPNFLQDFCAQRLIASPSTDGSFRYSLTELTAAQLYALIHGQEHEGELPEAICSATIDIDVQGRFTAIRFEAILPTEETGEPTVHALSLTLTQPKDLTPLQPPHWLP